MKAFVVGIAGVSVAMVIAAPASAAPDTNSRLVTPVTDVSSVTQLPAPLKTLIGPMADIGAPFNSTDDGTVSPLANAGTIDDTLCAVTDGAFAGKVPPYPDDSWQASGF